METFSQPKYVFPTTCTSQYDLPTDWVDGVLFKFPIIYETVCPLAWDCPSDYLFHCVILKDFAYCATRKLVSDQALYFITEIRQAVRIRSN